MDTGTATNLVTTAMENVGTAFTTAVGFVTQNAIAMVFIGFGIAKGAISLFRKVRKG